MAKVSSISDIKKAINNHETTLIPGNKKTKIMLTVLSKLPNSVFAAGATTATITAGASTAMAEAAAITTGQVWAIIAIAGVILIIGILRAKHARIKGKVGGYEFSVEYDM